MKKRVVLTALAGFLMLFAYTQNIGFGTNKPHASAILDLNSTTQGLLLPRMSTSEIFAIQNPAPGLLVYNTSYNEVYQYNGSAWRAVLNGNYWSRPIANRKSIANTTDSVGIGVALPTRLFDVNGTMRVRETLTADGIVNAGTVIASGNMVVGGEGVFNSMLQTNGDLLINNSSGILQFKTGGMNKAFVQLSGNDLRLGTNIGSTGSLVVRLNGTEPLKVYQNGKVDLEQNIYRSGKSGAHGLLPVAYGVMSRNGSLITGSSTDNVTTKRLYEGVYEITITDYLGAVTPVFVATPILEEYYGSNGLKYSSGSSTFIYVTGVSSNSLLKKTTIQVETMIILGGDHTEKQHLNTRFSFVIWDPLN